MNFQSTLVRTAFLVLVVSMIGWVSQAQAAFNNYGTFEATYGTYEDVIESSSTDSLPLFGAPIVNSNSLLFSPFDFDSVSSPDHGLSDITDSQLQMTISSDPGYAIHDIKIDEVGDVTLIGPENATAFAKIASPVFIRILEIDGYEIDMPGLTYELNYTPTGMFSLDDQGIVVGATFQGSLMVDLEAVLNEQQLPGHVTKLELTLDNSLATLATDGAYSLIKKKQAGISMNVWAVPEPGSASLLLVGLLSLGVVRRRRRTNG